MSNLKPAKPCPWCGANAEVWNKKIHETEPMEWHAGCPSTPDECPVCPITQAYDTPEEAVEAWDKRFA